MKEAVKIPYPTYQRLIDHLALHAPTDEWAASLLRELEAEAKDCYEQEIALKRN